MNSILVVLLGALGDVTRGFCILDPIKKAYPQSKITWLVEPRCKGIVDLHPLVDEVLVFNRDSMSWRNPFSQIIALKEKLAQRNFDCTLDLQRHFKSGFFSYLSKSKVRVGFNRKNCKEFNWIFNTIQTSYVPPHKSKVYNYLEFLPLIGVAIPDKPNFGIKSITLNSEDAFSFLENHKPTIGLVLGSQCTICTYW
jgi:ADP-heptose:LPS heptosyltransferase